MKRYNIVLLITMLLPLMAVAQSSVVTIPYTMSFEQSDPADSLEFSQWVLNPGANASACADRWEVGNQMHSDGATGVYISNQGPATTGYGDRPCVQFVYRDFQLATGNYYISFDYICPNADGRLYVGCLKHQGNTTQTGNMVAVNNPIGGATLPNVGGNAQLLPLSSTWASGSVTLSYTVPSNGQPLDARLYFAWVSNSHDSVPGIAAAIDNVQITSGNCLRPSDLKVDVLNCDSVLFSWEGSSVRYQAQYRKMGSNSWRSRSVRDGGMSVMLENMDEGNFDFRVRGICYETHEDGTIDTLYSPYAFLSNVNIFCPDRHCINYIAIDDTTKARCTWGRTDRDYFQEATLRSAYQNVGAVDFGWESINSRHTVVWDTTATDPRTGDGLRMVPVGEVASVRLGNWDTGQGAEAITYDFYVDPDNSILLLKYAIVLEDPDGHGEEAMPRFVLQIFDELGNPLDSVCGRVDLNPLSNGAEWNRYTPTGSGYYTDVVWKDWTMMGLNLDSYVGQRLKISVATYDCWWSGHYGYAYFTMGCASAHIKNTSCGAEQAVEVEAPEGFSYTWSNKVNSTTYNTRNITIGLADPTDWTCTLTSLENPDCFFELYVNTEPRYPVADFEVSYEPRNCENRYVFTNKSFIRVNNNGQIKDYYDEPCDDYYWDFGFDGEESDAKEPGVIIFPEQGGTYTVSLVSMIGDGTGTCRDEKVITLEVPAMGEHRGRKDTLICEGGYVDFYGERRFESGMYTFGGPDPKTGCWTVDTLMLTVVENSVTVLDTAFICYGDTFRVANMARWTTGDIVAKLVNTLGCDSNVVQPVHVADPIQPVFTVQPIDEDHEWASITVSGDGFTSFNFDGAPYSETVISDLGGGVYSFSFFNEYNCRKDTSVVIGKGCLRNIVFHRWNDVVSLMGYDYNGGLTFLTYQWYRDEVLIEGANKSYYYEPGGLTPGANYQCVVTYTEGEDTTIQEDITCAYVYNAPAGETSARVSPQMLPGMGTITVSVPEDCAMSLCSITGQVLGQAQLHAGDNFVTAPAAPGLYVLSIVTAGEQRPFRICVTH